MSEPIEIVAEIANAHQGEPAQAVALAEAALSAGADAIKFQVYSAEELVVRAHPRFEHFRRQAFDSATWADILGRFVGRGARVYCDVFGMDAFAIAARAGVAGFKVHASDLGNDHLLRAVAGVSGRALLATGGSTVREIAHAIALVTDENAERRPLLLHGFQSFPTALEDCALARLGWLERLFGARCDLGLSDHVAGDDPFATIVPLMAVPYGVRMIEKHVTLDRAAEGVDHYSSLEPDAFAHFVAAVRRAEAVVHGPIAGFSAAEWGYRETVKKHWVAARVLPAGHVLASGDVVMKRVPRAENAVVCDIVELDELVGRPLLGDVAAETPVTRAHVPVTVWACVVARMASSRLPGKALVEIAGRPALAHLFERLKQAETPDRTVLCTTTEAQDDPLAELARACGVAVHRGPVDDVLGRMLGAIEGQAVDVVLRITGDDILVDPDYLDRAVRHHLTTNAEYSDLKALPSGTEIEVFDTALLCTIRDIVRDAGGTEYLTTYIVDNRDQFRTTSVPVDPGHARDWRLTLDTPEDLSVLSKFLEAMAARGKALDYRLDDIVAYFEAHPEVLSENARVRQRQTLPEICTDVDWRRVV